MSAERLLAEIRQAHGRLPWVLRVWALTPLTLGLVVFLGMTFTLPPGPLCDEGMVLFMEGGCDYGWSNVFFFSKLGLLLAINAALVVAAYTRRASLPAFAPHLAVLLGLSLAFFSGGRCATYYGHPNGSMGQMTLEVAAFSLLGLSLLGTLQERPSWWLLPALVLWNGAYLVTFYVWLSVTSHWTWLHTVLVAGSMIALATVWRRTVARAPAASRVV